MDPFVAFDCARVLPNRFALAPAAAARSRGAEPQLVRSAGSTSDLALKEIAAGAFTGEELTSFLINPNDVGLLPHLQ